MRTRIRTNRDRLVEQCVLGEVSNPVTRQGRPWRIGPDGVPLALPGVGGITYNCKVGDSALDWEADHVEPGVSIKNKDRDSNAGLNFLACVGNSARIVSGDAKGKEGVVTGKHGGIEHVLVDFPDEAMNGLAIGDKVQVRTRGVGLKLLDFPGVTVMNLDPDLLERTCAPRGESQLDVCVTHMIPGAAMGSGIGSDNAYTGDYDIQLFDEQLVEQYGLANLKLGDIVAVLDVEHSYGRVYRQGAVTIGIVVHTRCVQAGHGPGVTTLLTCAGGEIVPSVHAEANLAAHMGLGRRRPGGQ